MIRSRTKVLVLGPETLGARFASELEALGLDVEVRQRAVDAEFEQSAYDLLIAPADPAATEDQYQTVFRVAGEGIALSDAQGRFQAVNPRCCEILGQTEEELLGKHPSEVVEAPEGPGVIVDNLQAMQPGDVMETLRVLRRPDGATLFLSVNTVRLPDLGYAAFIRDVTEQRRVDEELRQSKARLEEAERIAGLGNWYWDIPSGQILWSDQVYRIFGALRDEFEPTYEGFLGKIHPDDRARVQTAVNGALDSGDPYVAEHRIRLPNGSYRLVEERGELVRGEDGEPVGMRGTVHDITERKQVEELQKSLHRSETLAAMGRLVSGVAHEVRNPLFGLSASLDAMGAEFGDDENLRPFLDVFRSQISRMSALMQDLLQLSKPTTREMVGISPRRLAEQAAQHCQTRLGPFDFRIESTEDDEGGGIAEAVVVVDEVRFVQVLVNLLENAAQHSDEGSEILLRLSCLPGDEDSTPWVRFEVSDFGPGVPEANLERIFEPFFSRRKGGTGLGLSIVDHIVREHDGEVRARNRRRPGDPDGTPTGAIMVVRIPNLGGLS